MLSIREKKVEKKQKRGETDGKLTGVPYILATFLLNVPTLCHGLRTYLFWLGPGAEFTILRSKQTWQSASSKFVQ